MQRIVLTGGPGAGKTALLHALGAQGYAVVDESARTIIQSRRSRELSPRPQPLEFAQEVLRQDIDKYHRHASDSGSVFFDRCVLDALCMLDQVTPLSPGELAAFLSRYPYYRQVFFLPPWEAIYSNDAERDQTFAEAVAVHERLAEWYRRCGYEVMDVPTVTVAERCGYVLQTLGRDALP
jgi:predicted ATPase